MKFTLLVVLGSLLQVVVTKTVYNKQEEEHIAYNDSQDAYLWEKSGKVEGDMVLTPEQGEMYLEREKRNGLINPKRRWPKGVIPYVISDDFTSKEKSFIKNVLRKEYARTCIRMVPRTNQRDYVYVTGDDDRCNSMVGRKGGQQILKLNPNKCLTYRTVVHEFLHAAGFHHMQSASNRDKFVEIQWQNIKKDHEKNFKRYKPQEVSSFGYRYDFGSIMHYRPKIFSKNGLRTTIPKQKVSFGGAPRLSRVDIAKLNRMYKC